MAGQSRTTWIVNEYSTFDPYECLKIRLQENWRDKQAIRVVTIIGPQKCGKSHLLNKVFGTKFKVDHQSSEKGTKGIWMQRSSLDPPMLIMDIEGSDSAQSEGCTIFENRVALFAITMSHVMLLNFKEEGIGQHNGGCVPLLEIIFKERVKYTEAKTLIVVTLRDCKNIDGETYEQKVTINNEEKVKRKMKKIWVEAHTDDSNNPTFEDYIEVSVVQFPYFEYVEAFQNKCSELKNRLTTGDLIRPWANELTAEMMFEVMEMSWKQIRSNPKLCIPTVKSFMSGQICEQIQEDILGSTLNPHDENYTALLDMSDSTTPREFCRKLNELVNSASSKFEDLTSGQNSEMRNRNKRKIESGIINKSVIVNKLGCILNANKEGSKSRLYSNLRNMKGGNISYILTFSYDTIAFVDRQDVENSIINFREQELHDNLYCEGFAWPEDYKDIIEKHVKTLEEAIQKATRKLQGRHWALNLGWKVFIGLVLVGVSIYAIYTYWPLIHSCLQWLLNVMGKYITKRDVLNFIVKFLKYIQKAYRAFEKAQKTRSTTGAIARATRSSAGAIAKATAVGSGGGVALLTGCIMLFGLGIEECSKVLCIGS